MKNQDLDLALKLCGVRGAVFAPLLIHNPDYPTTPDIHFTAVRWRSGDRDGIINRRGYRVTEFKAGKVDQKVLSFGKPVLNPTIDKKEKPSYSDHPNEKAYSFYRFSLYGTG